MLLAVWSFFIGYAIARWVQSSRHEAMEKELKYARALRYGQEQTIIALEKQLELTAKKLHIANCWRLP